MEIVLILMYQGNFELIKKELVIEKNLNRFSKTKNYNYYLLNLFSKFFPSNKIMIENIQIGFFNYVLLSLKLKRISIDVAKIVWINILTKNYFLSFYIVNFF